MYNTKLFRWIRIFLVDHSTSFSFSGDHEIYSFKNKVFSWSVHNCDCGDIDMGFYVFGVRIYSLMHGHMDTKSCLDSQYNHPIVYIWRLCVGENLHCRLLDSLKGE